MEPQTVHPSTRLGRMVEDYGELAPCYGPMETQLKSNMWSFFSYAFVEGMKMKRQDIVVALVRKETEGERPLSEPVLFQYEVP